MGDLNLNEVLQVLVLNGISMALQDGNVVFEGDLSALNPNIRRFLQQHKPQLVQMLVSAETVCESIPPTRGDGPMPLSYAQQRLWLMSQFDRSATQFNIPVLIRLDGEVDVVSMTRAFNAIVERHEVLRTVFVTGDDGEVSQVVIPMVERTLELLDLAALVDEVQAGALARSIDEVVSAPFDLSSDAMLRVRLVRLSAEAHVLVACMHHIAADGWSVGVLTEELGRLYDAFSRGQASPLPPLSIQYGDFARWQRDWLQGERLARLLDYWRGRLADLPAVHGLPLDFARPAMPGHAGAVLRQTLPVSLLRALQALGHAHGATLFMVLHAAFVALQYRYSGARDIVVGTPIANREHAQLAPLVGFFVNTLVLRAELSEGMSFDALLAQGRTRLLEAYEHQQLPFERLVEALQPERSLAHAPLFQVMVALQNNRQEALTLSGLVLSAVEGEEVQAQYDLSLNMTEMADGLLVNWEYARALFAPETIARMAGHFERLLQAIVVSPEVPLGRLPMLSQSERAWLVERNGEPAYAGGAGGVPALIEAQAAARPEAVSVVCGSSRLSYGELNRRANRFARRLAAAGVGRGDLVGLCLERTPDMVVGLLAILKAGAVYVPLDVDYPQSRLAHLVEDAQIRHVVVERATRSRLPLSVAAELAIDDETQWPTDDAALVLARSLESEDGAYVIYTSGSTGKPKGVEVSHGNLCALLESTRAAFGVGAEDVMAALASNAFDIALFEMLLPLVSGGCTVLVSKATVLDGAALAEACGACTLLHGVPSLMEDIVAQREAMKREGRECYARVRTVFVGGDRVSPALVMRLTSTFERSEVVELYGPTEATILSTCHRVARGEVPVASNIGSALPHAQVYVLDANQELVPVCVPGELYIGGAGVAKGYRRQAALTETRFVADTLSGRAGARLYRSGDLVRWRRDGTLEYLGRSDNQVKLRGYRIEPGEIESQLRRQAGVKDAQVRLVTSDGQPRLVGYVLSEDAGEQVDGETLKRALGRELPEYMVPQSVVVLTSWPLTPNGKVDGSALLAMAADAARASYVGPSSEVERALVSLWADLLGQDADGISVETGFFALGGHSLLVARMMIAIQRRFDVPLGVGDIFTHQTISSLARRIAELRGTTPIHMTMAPDGPAPLSFAQQRMWLEDRIAGGSAHYNLFAAYRLDGHLDVPLLTDCLRALVRRHETLRTVFLVNKDEELQQVVLDEFAFDVSVHDLDGLDDARQAMETKSILALQAAHVFDLRKDVTMGACVVKLRHDDFILGVAIHHIAADGWSVGILLDELGRLYDAGGTRATAVLPQNAFRYRDYAFSQRADHLQTGRLSLEREAWIQTLSDLPVVHSLPLDHPRPEQRAHTGRIVSRMLPNQLAAGVSAMARRAGTTVFAVLHAVLVALVYRYTGEKDVVVGAVVNNREHHSLERLVGFFVNTIVLRSRFGETQSFMDVLDASTRAVVDAMRYNVPFEVLVERLAPERARNHLSLFQIMLSMDDYDSSKLPLVGLGTAVLNRSDTAAIYDLALNASANDRGLTLNWIYDTALFEHASIERMAVHFETLLTSALAAPDRDLDVLDMLSSMEVAMFAREWSAQVSDRTFGECFHELFEQQARLKPAAVAATDSQGGVLTYGELNAAANQLAHCLVERGMKPDTLVGLSVERSVGMLVGMLGILKAGGAYVPLDPEYPRDRLEYMIADGELAYFVTQTRLLGEVIARDACHICVDDKILLSRYSSDDIPVREIGLTSEHRIYVIYTSGSTGRPKGVQVRHRNILAFVRWAEQVYEPEQLARVLAGTTLNFDVNVLELHVPLGLGYEVIVVRDVLELLEKKFEPTLVTAVPSAMAVLLEQDAIPASAIAANIGGEAVPGAVINRLLTTTNCKTVFHVYGPTEDTVQSTSEIIRAPIAGKPSLGKPVLDTRLYILSERGTLLPEGAVGELHVGGAGLSMGYLHLPELTNAKFIANPVAVAPDARIYKTGDLVRRRPGGYLEYIGRVDNQVKIRGFRIELGEIEKTIMLHDRVDRAVVMASAGEGAVLSAYLSTKSVAASGYVELVGEVAELLNSRLPGYMIPNSYACMRELPVSPNGKLDLQVLLTHPAVQIEEYVAPCGETQTTLALVWRELLAINTPSATARFFAVGGNSLQATRLHAMISARWDVSITIQQIFSLQSIRSIAAEIDRQLAMVAVLDGQGDAAEEAEEWLV